MSIKTHIDNHIKKFIGDPKETAQKIVVNNLDQLNPNQAVLIKGSDVDMDHHQQIVTTYVIND